MQIDPTEIMEPWYSLDSSLCRKLGTTLIHASRKASGH